MDPATTSICLDREYWCHGEQEARAMISSEELSLLLGGIDLAKTRRRSWWRKEPGWEQTGEVAAGKEAVIA